jgi:hypothetical protein
MNLSDNCKRHLEKKTGKCIVFKESDYVLESAVSFSQYVVNCNVLVTLIGEKHEHTFKCNAPSLTISEYCAKAVDSNPNCRIILEYYCGGEKIKADNPTQLNSDSIKNTYIQLKKNKQEKQILPLDYRPAFLTRCGQDNLYGDGWKKYKNPEKIIKDFIDPFWKGSDKFAMNNPQFYSDKVRRFLDCYYQEICSVFEEVEMYCENHENIENIKRKLFDAWKLVTDYFIIRKILKQDNSDIDEYILIVGEAHRVNIEKLFRQLSPLVQQIGNTQFGDKKKCVNLYETFKFKLRRKHC